MIIEAQRYGLHPDDIDFVVECLKKGKPGIVPTDSVYAYCSLSSEKAGFETICRLKHIDPKDAMMSIICRDLSQASEYFTQWDTPVSGAGDVNNDGFDDVIIGAPTYNNGESDVGKVFVYYGSQSGLSQTAQWSSLGNGLNYGYRVSEAGDVNNDALDALFWQTAARGAGSWKRRTAGLFRSMNKRVANAVD